MRMRTSMIAGAAAATTLLLAGCGSDRTGGRPEFADHPERSAEGKELHYFDTLEAMVSGSPVVVRGTVVKVAPGRVAGDSEADRIYFRNVTVQPLEVVKGADPAQPLVFEEQGWDAHGTGYVVNGMRWSEVGDEGWYFLNRGREGTLHPISSYGKFVLTGREPGPTGHDPQAEGPWAKQPIGQPQTINEHVRRAGGKR